MGTIRILLCFVILLSHILTAQTTQETTSKPVVYRQARDDRYFLNRYGTKPTTTGRTLRADERPEARKPESNNVEKRCIRCTTYQDPYDYRSTDRYDRDYDRNRNYDRYDDRKAYDDRYDYRYERDRYDYRYDSRYERPTYSDRDRWYERRPDYDRYDRYDRYDYRPSYDSRGSYGGDRGYEGYRGTGYDNRGYDYRRGYESKGQYRPWEEGQRGTGGQGYDGSGRGYYYAGGRPESGGYGGAGYAASWTYNRGDNWRDQGYPSYQYPLKDGGHYDNQGGGYRGYSYLYDRMPPQQNVTTKPNMPPGGAAKEEGKMTERPVQILSSKPIDTSNSG